MITKFNNYIVESRMSIDELEMLNPDQLGELLHAEVQKHPPDVKYIQDLIAVGCPIDYKNSLNWTVLHIACMDDDIKLVRFLVSLGADVNVGNKKGYTPLHCAWDNLKLFKFLISKGADVNARINIGAEVGKSAWEYATEKIKKAFPELNPNK